MKTCKKCGVSKGESGFLPQRLVCRLCLNASRRTPEGREKRRKHNATYAQTMGGRDALRRGARKYAATEAGAEKIKERGKRYRNDPEQLQKHRARNALNRAVATGTVKKPGNCSLCDTPASIIHGHHHLGYEKDHWLNVAWMCPLCHTREHRK